MNRTRLVLVLVVLSLAAALWLIARLQAAPPVPVRARVDLQQALSDSSGEFARVEPGHQLLFPQDHGEHPEFKTEWWYFTGNLQDQAGHEYGYQLTIFRTAATLPEAPNSSAWTASDVLMGHFAVSDSESKSFHSFERLARRALGLSGIEPAARRIWLEDWEIRRLEEGDWQLKARQKDVAIELSLHPQKPVVLQGDRGYSRKGPQSHHGSYYASLTRLQTRGVVSLDGQEHRVEGLSWFDHEWSSEALAEGLVGWDWFSLHLDDGRDLMLYLLRYKDGRSEPASSGSLVDARGEKTHLDLDDFQVKVLDYHRSPRGVNYPSRWSVTVGEIKLEIEPLLLDQEMDTTVAYWEGAVKVSGTQNGRGFVEMTGY